MYNVEYNRGMHTFIFSPLLQPENTTKFTKSESKGSLPAYLYPGTAPTTAAQHFVNCHKIQEFPHQIFVFQVNTDRLYTK